MEYGINKIIFRYIFIFYEKQLENIENRMIKWEDENDEIEDDGRMVKNWGIGH